MLTQRVDQSCVGVHKFAAYDKRALIRIRDQPPLGSSKPPAKFRRHVSYIAISLYTRTKVVVVYSNADGKRLAACVQARSGALGVP